MSFASNLEFMECIEALLDDWRTEGRAGPLAKVLPAYTAFNGLTDGWADLRDSLAAAAQDEVSDRERQLLDRLVRSAASAVRRS